MLINLKTILKHAYENHYAVGAFNVPDFNFLEAILAAAEESNSPVIINIAEVHLKYVTLENICPSILAMASRTKIPVALNFDHGSTHAGMMQAIRNGFTSVMFDGSKLDYSENITKSQYWVKLCRPLNISVEAELGAVGGSEDGSLVSSANPNLFTDPLQAGEFIQKTGIDALAVAIGNAHGKYQGQPKLDFERLDQINQIARIPLVLHGGSGIPDNDLQTAIKLGISKINFFTGMSQAAMETTQTALNDNPELYDSYPELIKKAKTNVKKVILEQMETFGSVNQAKEF